MILRPYQIKCVDDVFGRLAESRSTLAVLATGLGKTVIFNEAVRRWLEQTGRPALVVVHRNELADQAIRKLRALLGDHVVGKEMAGDWAVEAGPLANRVVVASVQTLTASDDRRLRRFAPDHFGLLVFDEAHHSVAATWKRVADYFATAKLLGVTATPNRADELALGQIFESTAFTYPVVDAINDGWLVPVRQQAVLVDELDFSNVKTNIKGDLSEGELDAILREESMVHKLVKPTLDIVGDMPTLFFCAGVGQAAKTAEVINRYKPHSAEFISGETPRDERQRIVAAYCAGEIQFLANCMVFTEGFDAPATAAVVMGRPTKSMPLYQQVIGRATRPLEGVVDRDDLRPACRAEARRVAIRDSSKPSCLVLDFVGNSGRHKLVTALDVLGGKFGEPVREYARKTQEEEGEAAQTDEALERASDELDLLRVDAMRRKRVKAKAADFSTVEVSPFARGSASVATAATRQDGDAILPWQFDYLVNTAGWSPEKARRVPRGMAFGIIKKHKARTGRG